MNGALNNLDMAKSAYRKGDYLLAIRCYGLANSGLGLASENSTARYIATTRNRKAGDAKNMSNKKNKEEAIKYYKEHCKGLSKNEAAKIIAEKFGYAEKTVRNKWLPGV